MARILAVVLVVLLAGCCSAPVERGKIPAGINTERPVAG